MKVFLINIKSDAISGYYKLCYEVLMDYFNKHKIDVFVLNKNEYGVHPSWLKMKCFDYVDDEFVLCWDMDLLPRKNCPSIVDYLNFDKINLVRDSIFYNRNIKDIDNERRFYFN